uniref:Uncharacterized protein n=1 Tax=Tanacetum cinerariifolium TaxID=118510 RepID=A0A699GGR3_TANCI|nr:hypothetical protein [Tanacetum cinerariifolium]
MPDAHILVIENDAARADAAGRQPARPDPDRVGAARTVGPGAGAAPARAGADALGAGDDGGRARRRGRQGHGARRRRRRLHDKTVQSARNGGARARAAAPRCGGRAGQHIVRSGRGCIAPRSPHAAGDGGPARAGAGAGRIQAARRADAPPGPGPYARPAARPGLGQRRLPGRAHGRYARRPPAQRLAAVRPAAPHRNRARQRLPLRGRRGQDVSAPRHAEPLVILSQREQEYLLHAIETAPPVDHARQFYLWTQGPLQALLPHQHGAGRHRAHPPGRPRQRHGGAAGAPLPPARHPGAHARYRHRHRYWAWRRARAAGDGRAGGRAARAGPGPPAGPRHRTAAGRRQFLCAVRPAAAPACAARPLPGAAAAGHAPDARAPGAAPHARTHCDRRARSRPGASGQRTRSGNPALGTRGQEQPRNRPAPRHQRPDGQKPLAARVPPAGRLEPGPCDCARRRAAPARPIAAGASAIKKPHPKAGRVQVLHAAEVALAGGQSAPAGRQRGHRAGRYPPGAYLQVAQRVAARHDGRRQPEFGRDIVGWREADHAYAVSTRGRAVEHDLFVGKGAQAVGGHAVVRVEHHHVDVVAAFAASITVKGFEYGRDGVGRYRHRDQLGTRRVGPAGRHARCHHVSSQRNLGLAHCFQRTDRHFLEAGCHRAQASGKARQHRQQHGAAGAGAGDDFGRGQLAHVARGERRAHHVRAVGPRDIAILPLGVGRRRARHPDRVAGAGARRQFQRGRRQHRAVAGQRDAAGVGRLAGADVGDSALDLDRAGHAAQRNRRQVQVVADQGAVAALAGDAGAAQVALVVGRASVVHQARIGGAAAVVRLAVGRVDHAAGHVDVAGALAEGRGAAQVAALGVLEGGRGGGHQRRLDRRRRPGRVLLVQQRRHAGHVRRGHRGALVEGPRRSGTEGAVDDVVALFRRQGRCDAGQDFDAGRSQVRFELVGVDRVGTARGKRRNHRRVRADVAAEDAERRLGRCGSSIRLDRGAVGGADVYRGHRMNFSDQAVAIVDHDHAHAAGLLDRQALVDAVVGAAHAGDDLAGHLGRVETGAAGGNAAEAQAGGVGVGAGRAGVEAAHDRRAGRQCVVVERRTLVAGAVAERDRGAQQPRMGCGGHRGQPRAVVVDGIGGTVVAARGGDKHAGVGRVQECLLDRVVRRRAAADRIVEHVNAVDHRLFDGGCRVGAPAAIAAGRRVAVREGPADLVGGDARARRHARNGAQRHVVADRGGHAVVAARRAGGMGAMAATADRAADRIARRDELAPVDADGGGAETVDEVARADQLVVAMGHGEAFAGFTSALPADWRVVGQGTAVVERGLAVAVDAVGKRRAFRPDTGVDHADHDVFAGLVLAAQLLPQAAGTVEAEEGRGKAGKRLARRIGADGGDVGVGLERAHFGIGQHGGKAVQHHLVLVQDGRGRDDVLDTLLLLHEGAAVALGGGGVEIEPQALGRLGGGNVIDTARVRRHRLVGQLDDVGATDIVGVGLGGEAAQAGHGSGGVLAAARGAGNAEQAGAHHQPGRWFRHCRNGAGGERDVVEGKLAEAVGVGPAGGRIGHALVRIELDRDKALLAEIAKALIRGECKAFVGEGAELEIIFHHGIVGAMTDHRQDAGDGAVAVQRRAEEAGVEAADAEGLAGRGAAQAQRAVGHHGQVGAIVDAGVGAAAARAQQQAAGGDGVEAVDDGAGGVAGLGIVEHGIRPWSGPGRPATAPAPSGKGLICGKCGKDWNQGKRDALRRRENCGRQGPQGPRFYAAGTAGGDRDYRLAGSVCWSQIFLATGQIGSHDGQGANQFLRESARYFPARRRPVSQYGRGAERHARGAAHGRRQVERSVPAQGAVRSMGPSLPVQGARRQGRLRDHLAGPRRPAGRQRRRCRHLAGRRPRRGGRAPPGRGARPVRQRHRAGPGRTGQPDPALARQAHHAVAGAVQPGTAGAAHRRPRHCGRAGSAAGKGSQSRHARRAGALAGRPARRPALFRRAGRSARPVSPLVYRHRESGRRHVRSAALAVALHRLPAAHRPGARQAGVGCHLPMHPAAGRGRGQHVPDRLRGAALCRGVPGRRARPAVAVAANAQLGTVRQRPHGAAAGRDCRRADRAGAGRAARAAQRRPAAFAGPAAGRRRAGHGLGRPAPAPAGRARRHRGGPAAVHRVRSPSADYAHLAAHAARGRAHRRHGPHAHPGICHERCHERDGLCSRTGSSTGSRARAGAGQRAAHARAPPAPAIETHADRGAGRFDRHGAARAGARAGAAVRHAGAGNGRHAGLRTGLRPAAAVAGHGAPLRAAAGIAGCMQWPAAGRDCRSVRPRSADLAVHPGARHAACAAGRAAGAAGRHPGVPVQAGGIGARHRHTAARRQRGPARRQDRCRAVVRLGVGSGQSRRAAGELHAVRRAQGRRLRHPPGKHRRRPGRQVPGGRRARSRHCRQRHRSGRADHLALEGAGGTRYRRAPRAAGRQLPGGSQWPRDRPARLHHAQHPRRGRGDPDPGQARHDRGVRRPHAGSLGVRRAVAGHVARAGAGGVRHAARDRAYRPGGVPAARHPANSRQRKKGADVCQGPALDPAPRSGQDHGGGDSRPRNGGNRRAVGADRPPGAHHRPRQQRVRRVRPVYAHGHRSVRVRLGAQRHLGPAPDRPLAAHRYRAARGELAARAPLGPGAGHAAGRTRDRPVGRPSVRRHRGRLARAVARAGKHPGAVGGVRAGRRAGAHVARHAAAGRVPARRPGSGGRPALPGVVRRVAICMAGGRRLACDAAVFCRCRAARLAGVARAGGRRIPSVRRGRGAALRQRLEPLAPRRQAGRLVRAGARPVAHAGAAGRRRRARIAHRDRSGQRRPGMAHAYGAARGAAARHRATRAAAGMRCGAGGVGPAANGQRTDADRLRSARPCTASGIQPVFGRGAAGAGRCGMKRMKWSVQPPRAMRIDFAPRSLRRALFHTHPALLAAAVAGLLLCVAAGVGANRLAEDQRTRAEQLQHVRERAAAMSERPATTVRVAIPEAQAAFVNGAILQLNLPWRELQDAVEAATPRTIALVALEPDARKQVLKITAEAMKSDDMVDYVTELKQQETFSAVAITRVDAARAAGGGAPGRAGLRGAGAVRGRRGGVGVAAAAARGARPADGAAAAVPAVIGAGGGGRAAVGQREPRRVLCGAGRPAPRGAAGADAVRPGRQIGPVAAAGRVQGRLRQGRPREHVPDHAAGQGRLSARVAVCHAGPARHAVRVARRNRLPARHHCRTGSGGAAALYPVPEGGRAMKPYQIAMALALVGAAGLVLFGDRTPAADIVEPVARRGAAAGPAPRSIATAPARADGKAAANVAILRLKPRTELVGEAGDATFGAGEGVFQGQNWNRPPPAPTAAEQAAANAPPPPPTAPPVPFNYFGKAAQDGVWEVYLARGDKTYVVRNHTVIDGAYRIDRIAPPLMTVTYLPLNQASPAAAGAVAGRGAGRLRGPAGLPRRQHPDGAGPGGGGPAQVPGGAQGRTGQRRIPRRVRAGARPRHPALHPRRRTPAGQRPAATGRAGLAPRAGAGPVQRTGPRRTARAGTQPASRQGAGRRQRPCRQGRIRPGQTEAQRAAGRNPHQREGAQAAARRDGKNRATGHGNGTGESVQAADHDRVPRRAVEAGIRGDLAPVEPEFRVRQGRQDRPAHHGPAAQQHGGGGDLLPAAHQSARAAGDGRQHGADLPEYGSQAEGIPGDDGQDLLPGQCRRQAGDPPGRTRDRHPGHARGGSDAGGGNPGSQAQHADGPGRAVAHQHRHQPGRQHCGPADQGQRGHRRQAAGGDAHRVRWRGRLCQRERDLRGRGPETVGGAHHLSQRRNRDQGGAGSEQPGEHADHQERQHGLSTGHAPGQHHAATEGWREPGAGRPDQQRAARHRQQDPRRGRPADPGPAVRQPARRQPEDGDRAVDHAAPDPQRAAARGQRVGILGRHRVQLPPPSRPVGAARRADAGAAGRPGPAPGRASHAGRADGAGDAVANAAFAAFRAVSRAVATTAPTAAVRAAGTSGASTGAGAAARACCASCTGRTGRRVADPVDPAAGAGPGDDDARARLHADRTAGDAGHRRSAGRAGDPHGAGGGAAPPGAGPARSAAADPQRHRRLQAGVRPGPRDAQRHVHRLPENARRAGGRRARCAKSQAGQDIFSAPGAARSVQSRRHADGGANLGQAQLRQRSRRSERGRGRVRRLQPEREGGPERRALSKMVSGSGDQMKTRASRGARFVSGFTLIELLVVLGIVALMLTLAVPRYFPSVDKSKEVVLADNLRNLRGLIDQYYGDTGRYPDSLDQLVEKKYLRALPRDPATTVAASLTPTGDGPAASRCAAPATPASAARRRLYLRERDHRGGHHRAGGGRLAQAGRHRPAQPRRAAVAGDRRRLQRRPAKLCGRHADRPAGAAGVAQGPAARSALSHAAPPPAQDLCRSHDGQGGMGHRVPGRKDGRDGRVQPVGRAAGQDR